MSNGWIKLHRKKLDWPWFRKPYTAHLFEYILLSATHTESVIVIGGKEVRLQPGDMIFGRHSAAERTGLSEKNVRTALQHLLQANCVKSANLPTRQASILSICNWALYQCPEVQTGQPIGQPSANHRPTIGHIQECKEGKERQENSQKQPCSADAERVASNGDGFEEWWGKYPQYQGRKAGRKQCLEHWKRHKLGEQREAILKGLEVAKAIWAEKGFEFMKGPLPWLRQEPWLEEQVTPQQSREAAQEAHTQEVLSMFRRLADEEKQENAGE